MFLSPLSRGIKRDYFCMHSDKVVAKGTVSPTERSEYSAESAELLAPIKSSAAFTLDEPKLDQVTPEPRIVI